MSLSLARTATRPSKARAIGRSTAVRPVPLEIALINNMPDSALRSAERQFLTLVQEAADRIPVRLHLFTLPSTPRGDDATRHLAAAYAPFSDLLGRSFDGAIVTGNEPRATRLQDEPYWRDMTRLITWADTSTRSSIWSCLAAHAAVLHLHGIERRPRATKLSGIFPSRIDAGHPLLQQLGTSVATPHSRWNDLRRDDLLAHGCRILSEGDGAGVDLFAWQGRSSFLFFQGHPEYETDTLLREYRRDVGRFLRGESDTYPTEPAGYFRPEAMAVLNAFRRRACAHRDPTLFDVFPNVASPFAIENTWRRPALQFYRNWLTDLAAQKASRRQPPA